MIKAVYTVHCECCDNVPGFDCEFLTIIAATVDAREKGWLIGPEGYALCPYCRKVKNV